MLSCLKVLNTETWVDSKMGHRLRDPACNQPRVLLLVQLCTIARARCANYFLNWEKCTTGRLGNDDNMQEFYECLNALELQLQTVVDMMRVLMMFLLALGSANSSPAPQRSVTNIFWLFSQLAQDHINIEILDERTNGCQGDNMCNAGQYCNSLNKYVITDNY